MKLQCHSGADGVIAEANKANSQLQRHLPEARPHPEANKDLVLTDTDTHGEPPSPPGTGCARDSGPADAYDWNFCWKVWDALRSCAYSATNCRYALGNTRQHRSNGRWSDGVPVTPLKIQDAAPIRP